MENKEMYIIAHGVVVGREKIFSLISRARTTAQQLCNYQDERCLRFRVRGSYAI